MLKATCHMLFVPDVLSGSQDAQNIVLGSCFVAACLHQLGVVMMDASFLTFARCAQTSNSKTFWSSIHEPHTALTLALFCRWCWKSREKYSSTTWPRSWKGRVCCTRCGWSNQRHTPQPWPPSHTPNPAFHTILRSSSFARRSFREACASIRLQSGVGFFSRQ